MVKKKSKRLTTQNGSETNKCSQESIKKYCTKKKNIKQNKNCGKIRKNDYLRNNNMKNLKYSTPNSKYNKRKKSLLNVKNDITVYEVKTISPTKVIVAKVAINVKNFYNNKIFKQYEENLHLYNKNKNTIPAKKDVDHNTILNDEKTCRRTKNKCQRVNNYPRKHGLIPQLNKEPCKKIRKLNDAVKSANVIHKKCNLENEEILLNSSQKTISNETQTNEHITEEYQETQSINNAPSISVKRFYNSEISFKINDGEKFNKDIRPLISDTTFNSKADQSPSKSNSSHKISLNVKLISGSTTNNKQQKVTAFFPIRRSARKSKNIVDEEKQLALEKAIVSQNEDGLKIAVFPDKGRGIIADRDFVRGEYVVEYAGELICLTEARKRETIYSQDTTTGCYMYYFKYGSIHYCIDATAESSRLGRLVNHSRFGNLGPKIVELSGIPRIVLVAKLDIKQGEELTYDYGDRSKQSLVNHPWLAY